MMTIWWFSLIFLATVWLAYPLLLGMLASGAALSVARKSSVVRTITVVIAAHNEAKNLPTRIENIYGGNYPVDLVQVVVASDGSTDEIGEVLAEMKHKYPGIKLVDIQPQGGRSSAHNKAIGHCSGDILVFTDAETHFAPDFLEKITLPFESNRVGFASGVLKYRNQKATAVTESAGFYWRYEYFLRERETKLGIYAFGSGACCAVRKDLYRDIPAVGDVDFTTPLDVVLQGKQCIHVSDALAFDEMPESPQREFRARVRMTSKNFYGTIQRWGWVGIFHHPVYTMVILLHKILRWMTPFGMIGLLISNPFLLGSGQLYSAIMVGQVLFYLIALAGYFGIPVPLSRQIYSFCLANLGFFVGIVNAVTGRVPKAYVPNSQT